MKCQLTEPVVEILIHTYAPVLLPLYISVIKLGLMCRRRENRCLCQLSGPLTCHITDKYLEARSDHNSTAQISNISIISNISNIR